MAFFPRGFSCHLKINILLVRLDTRGYSRILHRNPIKIFISDKAKKSNSKPSLVYHDSILDPLSSGSSRKEHQTIQKNIHPMVGCTSSKIPKQSQNKDIAPKVEKLQSTMGPDRSSYKKNYHVSTIREVPKPGKMAVLAYGEKIEVNVVTEKSVSHRKLSSLLMSIKSTKARQMSGKVLLEGERLISDAMRAGVHIEAIFFSNAKLLTTLPLESQTSTQFYQVDHGKIQLWSDLVTSPGIMGIFAVSNIKDSTLYQQIPLTIICDNVRDPGNMGSIIRCAAAVGCKNLITTQNCVDVWDSKVLRAASGAHFRMKLTLNVDWDLIAENFVTQDDTVLLADAHIQGTTPASDVAGTSSNDLSWLERENNTNPRVVEALLDGSTQVRDSSYLDEKKLRLYRNLPLRHFSYDKLNLDTASVTLVIGGETHGLSSAAHKLAHDYGGLKVFIPLANEVDSLNAGVATGILVYELRRLFLQKKKNSLGM